MGEWLAVTVNAPPVSHEAVSSALFELGATAIWDDTPDEAGRLVLKASFGRGDAMRLMMALPRSLRESAKAFGLSESDFSLALELVPLEDYSAAWKAGLAPIQVSPSLVVAPPSWEGDLPGHLGIPPDRLPQVLRLDPGAAFGSGRHPTTFLCLKLLSSLAEAKAAPQRILDVGSGSGILSLAAALLFPGAEILGIDNDPLTLAVAAANRDLNGLGANPGFSGAPASELAPGAYSLILANLALNPLLGLAPTISSLAAPGARLVVSGLVLGQAAEAAGAFQKEGWAWEAHLGQGEWSALSLSLGGPGPKGDPKAPPRELVPEPSLETKPGNVP
jgi:ribosomal protein L11 methyltransferase